MICNCRGGPNCCMRQSFPPAVIAPLDRSLAPFKCADCGTWWAGEHRCLPPANQTLPNTQTITVRCTCGPNRLTNALRYMMGTCPLHDVRVNY